MKKRMVIMLIVVGILFGGIFGFEAFKNVMIKKFMTSISNPTQTISAVTAKEAPWRTTLEAVGSLRAHRGADLSPQVAGIVASIQFKSGEHVKKGQVLLTLSDKDDRAQLAALKAAENIAQITYDRDKRQYDAQAISKQTLQSARAQLKQAKANVARQQAVLSYKIIRAPFDGRLGIRQVDLGQYLNPGTKIVTLQALNPIYVDFYLPQQALSQLSVGQKVTTTTDVYSKQTFTGRITAVNPTVDTSTRNVQIRAALKNPKDKLLPGMYATVDVTTGAPTNYITVPQTAITYNPYGNTVYLVVPQKQKKTGNNAKGKTENGKSANGKPQLIAEQKFVTTGATRGDQIQILKGVKAGDIIVSSGQIKLHNGSKVKINNTIQPTNNPHPTPQDQ